MASFRTRRCASRCTFVHIRAHWRTFANIFLGSFGFVLLKRFQESRPVLGPGIPRGWEFRAEDSPAHLGRVRLYTIGFVSAKSLQCIRFSKNIWRRQKNARSLYRIALRVDARNLCRNRSGERPAGDIFSFCEKARCAFVRAKRQRASYDWRTEFRQGDPRGSSPGVGAAGFAFWGCDDLR